MEEQQTTIEPTFENSGSGKRSLHEFVGQIAKEPPLKHSDMMALFRRMRNKKNRRSIRERAREKLITSNVRLVFKFLPRGYKEHDTEEMFDFISEGIRGVVRAVDKFDPARGNRFSTYAVHWIKQCVRRSRVRSEVVRLPYKKDNRNCVLRHKRDRTEEEEEEFRKLHVSVIHPREGRDTSVDIFNFIRDPVDLEENIKDDDDRRKSVAIVQEILRSDMLTPREKRIFVMLYGIGDEEPKNMSEIADILKLSRERIRQIIFKAERKLRMRIPKKFSRV